MNFLDWVNYEREIFCVINKEFMPNNYLYGLNFSALDDWINRAKPSLELSNYLKELSSHIKEFKSVSAYSLTSNNEVAPALEKVIKDLNEILIVGKKR